MKRLHETVFGGCPAHTRYQEHCSICLITSLSMLTVEVEALRLKVYGDPETGMQLTDEEIIERMKLQ